MILKRIDENEEDLFQKNYLEKVFDLQTQIEKSKITFLEKEYSLRDFCFRPISSQGCLVTSPMDYWKTDLEKMRLDPDIKETAKCLKQEIQKDLPCMDRIGAPVQVDAIFGGTGCEKGETSTSCTLCRKTAKALIVTFLLNNNYYTNQVASLWERDVLIKNINEFNKKEKANNLKIEYLSERSIPDELGEENSQNIMVVVLSYLAMFLYISVSMGEFPSVKLSRVLVAFGGIMVVVFSFLGSVAIVSFMGIKFSLISSEVVPFLVLAIGVDNMFIITGAKDRKMKKFIHMKELNPNCAITEEMALHDIVAGTLKEVGPSITTAALSEFLAFLVGYLTNIPALESFCLAAAFAVLIDYLLQMTVFLAFVTLDEVRVRSRRFDIFPCLTFNDDSEISKKYGHGRSRCQDFLSGTFYNFLLKPFVYIPILVFYAGLLVVSCIGMTQIPLGLDQKTTVIQGGNLYNYFLTQEKFVDVGPPSYLVFYNIDYNNDTNLKILDEVLDYISFLPSVKPPVYSWYKDFKKFMDKEGEWKEKCNPNLEYLTTLPLELQVAEFLKTLIDAPCCTEEAICGEQYKSDIYFHPEGFIEATRFRFQHQPLRKQKDYVDSIIQTKVVAGKYKDRFSTLKDKKNDFYIGREDQLVPIDPVFTYSLFYVYYDQYFIIRGVSVQNTLIALAAIFLAVQLIMNVKSALVVTLFTFSCILNLVGVLWLLNFIPGYILELNAVSVVNMVLACGLSVEFTVHLIIFYLRCKKEDPKEKVRYALKNVGISVFVGIVTTKIIGKDIFN